MPNIYIQTTCDHCTLGEAMKDCPSCAFARGLTAPHATDNDIRAMYRRLWYPYTPKGVMKAERVAALEDREMLDFCEGLHVRQPRVFGIIRS